MYVFLSVEFGVTLSGLFYTYLCITTKQQQYEYEHKFSQYGNEVFFEMTKFLLAYQNKVF